jgi:hypothetical protein
LLIKLIPALVLLGVRFGSRRRAKQARPPVLTSPETWAIEAGKFGQNWGERDATA